MFVYTSGPAGLISALYDQLMFGSIIDELVTWDPKQCLLSPGNRIKAMVINIFCGSDPLYRIKDFYVGMDTENLFGKGIAPGDLTDYSLARALDKMHQAGEEKIYSTLKLDKMLKEQAWQLDDWECLGKFSPEKNAASYRALSFVEELYGQKYRFIVVHSSVLDGRKVKALEKELAKKHDAQEKAMQEIEKQSFACMPDAQQALAGYIRQHRDPFYPITGHVIKEEKRKPGRQPKGKPPNTSTIYRLKIEIGTDEDAIQKEKERRSCFVLITNILDKHTDSEILEIYKRQSSVESSFKFIKDPFYVGPTFFKKPGRIKAITYVILISLLLFYLMERRVREALKGEDEPLIVHGDKKTFRPTGKRILQLMGKMIVITTNDPYRRVFPKNLKVPEKLFRFVGVDPDVYLQIRERGSTN